MPGGSAAISGDPGSSAVDVSWSASCPNPGGSGNAWYVEIRVFHQDGSRANYKSTAESGVTADARTQRLGVKVAAGLVSETFTVTVTLVCYPYDDMVIGQGSFTAGTGGGGGDGGHGEGGSGGGHGGGAGGGGGPSDPVRPGGCAKELRGTAGPDVLDGTPEGDVVSALGGDDRVRGRDGDDCLIGGAGNDRLLGEDGFDRLTGGRGDDRLDGGPGRNEYDGGSGDDRIEARNGRAETVRCGLGEDAARADSDDRLDGCERVLSRYG